MAQTDIAVDDSDVQPIGAAPEERRGEALGFGHRGAVTPKGEDLGMSNSTLLPTPGGERAATAAFNQGQKDGLAQENSKRLAQFKGSRAQYYHDPSSGLYEQTRDSETNRPLFAPTQWEPGEHPETKTPSYVRKNRFGEAEYRPAPIVFSPDFNDDQGYYHFKETDTKIPAGKITELMAHPNFGVARAAQAANTRRVSAMWNTELEPRRIAKETASEAYNDARDAQAQIGGQIADVQKQIELAPDPATQAGLQATLDQLNTQHAQLGERLKPGVGDLASARERASHDYGIWASKAAIERYRAQRHEIVGSLKERGLPTEGNPTLAANDQALSVLEQKFQQELPTHLKSIAGDIQKQDVLTAGEPASLLQRGVKAIGGVSVPMMAQRYGNFSGAPDPAAVYKVHQRLGDIDSTLANPDSALSPKLAKSLNEERTYLQQLYDQRLARLSPDAQNRLSQVIDSEKTSTGGAFGRAALSTIPGAAGAIAGGEAGASIGAFGGPAAPVTVPVGAAIGALLGSIFADKGARKLASKVAPETYAKFQDYSAKDWEQHTAAVTGGQAAGMLAAFRLSSPQQAVRTAQALEKMAKGAPLTEAETTAAKAFAVQAGLAGATAVASPLIEGQRVDPLQALASAAQMMIFGQARFGGKGQAARPGEVKPETTPGGGEASPATEAQPTPQSGPELGAPMTEEEVKAASEDETTRRMLSPAEQSAASFMERPAEAAFRQQPEAGKLLRRDLRGEEAQNPPPPRSAEATTPTEVQRRIEEQTGVSGKVGTSAESSAQVLSGEMPTRSASEAAKTFENPPQPDATVIESAPGSERQKLSTEDFNKRQIGIMRQLRDAGIPLNDETRQGVRALALAETPEEYNFIRQQIIDRFGPEKPGKEQAKKLKSFSELNPSQFPKPPPEEPGATPAEKPIETPPAAPADAKVSPAPEPVEAGARAQAPVSDQQAIDEHRGWTKKALDESGEGHSFKYTVQNLGEGYPRAVQVDIFDKDGKNIGSSSVEELHSLGVDVPAEPPLDTPTGQYSPEEISKFNGQPKETPNAAETNQTAQPEGTHGARSENVAEATGPAREAGKPGNGESREVRVPEAGKEGAQGAEAVQQSVKPKAKRPAPSVSKASVPSDVKARDDGARAAEFDGKYQALLKATNRKAKSDAAQNFTPEEAKQALARLNAAPGYDAAAKIALERRAREAPKAEVVQREPLAPVKPFRETKADLLSEIDKALPKAGDMESLRQRAIEEAIKDRNYPKKNTEQRDFIDEKLRDLAQREFGTVAIESGNSKFTVTNSADALERLRKVVAAQPAVGRPTDATPANESISQKEAIHGYKTAKDEAARRWAMDQMTDETLKSIGLDKDYVRTAKGTVYTKEAAAELARLKKGETPSETEIEASSGESIASTRDVDKGSPAAFRYRDATPEELGQAKVRDLAAFERAHNADRARNGLDPIDLRAKSLDEANRGAATEGEVSAGGLRGAGPRPVADTARLHRALETALGKKIIFVQPSERVPWIATTSPEMANTIIVNTDAKQPFMASVGHELGHNIANQRPDLFKPFTDAVHDANPMPPGYLALKLRQGYNLTQARTEWANDTLGARFDEPEFWQKVSEKMSSPQSRSAFRELVSAAHDWLTKLTDRIKTLLHSATATPFVNDIERMREVAADMLARYQREGPYQSNTRLDFSKPEEVVKTVNASEPAKELRTIQDKIADKWKEVRDERDLKQIITADRDAAEGKANQFSREVRNTVYDSLKRSVADKDLGVAQDALTFFIESSDGDAKKLADFRNKIASSTKVDPKWQARALAAIDYAEKNGAMLKATARVYRQFTDSQQAREHAEGLPTLKVNDYVPRYQDVDDISFLGKGSGLPSTGSANRKVRSYDTIADSLAAGIDPKTLNAVDALETRVRTGETGVNLRQWQKSLADYKAPDGSAIAKQPARVERADGSYYFDAGKGYQLENVGNTPIAVKKEYAGLVSALTDPSWFNENKGRLALQKANALGKSIALAVDTFHLGRLAFRSSMVRMSSATNPKFGPAFKEGLLLAEHSPAEIIRMGKTGEIPAESVQGLLENKRILQSLIDVGFQSGRVADAMHQELIQKVPGLGDVNRFIFQKFQRGAMNDAAVLEYQRQRAAYPEMSDERVARKVAREVMTRFGNLGRQGWFKSQTAQDIARMIWLAPQWNEGLIRSEVGGLAQIGKSALNVAQGRSAAMGLLGREMLTTGISLFAASQVLNQITRGKFTWENPEEGFAANISAFIPDKLGGGHGFFFNPMGLTAETAHLILNAYERTGNTYDPIIGYLRSRASAVTRPAWSLFTGKDVLGRQIKPDDRWKEVAKDAIPAPISGGAFAHAAKGLVTGGATEQFPGQFQKQAMQSFGVRTELVPSPEKRIRSLATKFNEGHGIKKSGEFYASDYDELNDALRRGNKSDTASALRSAMDKHPGSEADKRKAIEDYYRRWQNTHFTGSAGREAAFLKTLNAEQRQQYTAAKQERTKLAIRAMQALRTLPRTAATP